MYLNLINYRCENLLGDFLKEISSPKLEKKLHEKMINIILIHCANVNGISLRTQYNL
jgi:hypothetical protein